MAKLIRTELHQPASSKRYRRKTEHRRIPAARRDIEGIDQTAVHFISNDDRRYQFVGACTFGLCNRETGCNVIARMNGDSSDVCVIEVEIAECGAVREGRQVGCRPPIGTNNSRRTLDGK